MTKPPPEVIQKPPAERAAGLSAAVVKRLRQPFAAEQLRWKIQANPSQGGLRDVQTEGLPFATVVVYVDVRTVTAHLDEVVPGRWSSEYRLPPVTVGLPALECRLTVCGVTRSDVGTVEPGHKAGSDTKDLYSDALKRAAVQYGVGAFLYRFPGVQAQVERGGQGWFVTREAQAELGVLTRAVLAGASRLPRFQALRVRGYDQGGVAGVSGGAEGPPPIGEGRGHKMEEQLALALRGSEWAGEPGADFAGYVLGLEVGSLAELTEGEATTVYRAARAKQAQGQVQGPAEGTPQAKAGEGRGRQAAV